MGAWFWTEGHMESFWTHGTVYSILTFSDRWHVKNQTSWCHFSHITPHGRQRQVATISSFHQMRPGPWLCENPEKNLSWSKRKSTIFSVNGGKKQLGMRLLGSEAGSTLQFFQSSTSWKIEWLTLFHCGSSTKALWAGSCNTSAISQISAGWTRRRNRSTQAEQKRPCSHWLYIKCLNRM